jgi:hypothetical protein
MTLTENTTFPLQFADDASDTQMERLLQLCDRLDSMADRTRAVLRHRQGLPLGDRVADADRNLLHLQARLEAISSRIQGTMPLIDSLDHAYGLAI